MAQRSTANILKLDSTVLIPKVHEVVQLLVQSPGPASPPPAGRTSLTFRSISWFEVPFK